MFNLLQQTINKPLIFEGVALHSGKSVKMTLLPAEEDVGIVFKRIDLKKNNIIKANYKNVSSATLCTTLENEFKNKVSTVEHLLAALYIKGIDSVVIEINGDEVPIMDGSSKDFLEAFNSIEMRVLKTKKRFLKILERFSFCDNEKIINIEPSDSFKVDFELNYENKIIGNQRNFVNFSKDSLDEVINSRTFCLFEDIEHIKKLGLAKGGSLANAVVVDDEKVLNKEVLRNQKEFVNHKILDLAGDFILSGFSFLGKVKCTKGGHQLSNLFLRELLDNNSDKFEIIEFELNKKRTSTSENYSSQIAVNA